MSTKTSEDIVRSHSIWALGAGLVPLPMFDMIAVTAIQLDMLKDLARQHGVDYTEAAGKGFVSALTGSTFAKLGSSALKTVPVVGTALGGVSMSVLSGASTYAVGQAAIRHLESSDDFLHVDLDSAREAYDEALERGKEYIASWKQKKNQSEDVFQAIKELSKLKKQGILSEEEFESKKSELLGRL